MSAVERACTADRSTWFLCLRDKILDPKPGHPLWCRNMIEVGTSWSLVETWLWCHDMEAAGLPDLVSQHGIGVATCFLVSRHGGSLGSHDMVLASQPETPLWEERRS